VREESFSAHVAKDSVERSDSGKAMLADGKRGDSSKRSATDTAVSREEDGKQTSGGGVNSPFYTAA